jgi:hypothetical protein
MGYHLSTVCTYITYPYVVGRREAANVGQMKENGKL